MEELCEAAYTDQLQLITGLLEACERFDRLEHGARVRGKITREAFNAVLGAFSDRLRWAHSEWRSQLQVH